MPKKASTPAPWTLNDGAIDAYSRAVVDMNEAAKVIAKGMPHDRADRERLAKAAKSLNAYLAELER